MRRMTGSVAGGAGDADALAHAARQFVRSRRGEVLQANQTQQLVRALKALRSPCAGELEPERDILSNRLPGEQSVLLEYDAAIGAGARDLNAINRDRPGGQRQE